MSMGTFVTVNVYCDMTTDGGGWIVIQRNRKNSQLSFNKNWREFEEGFGDLNKDFWAGLELMHTPTQRGQWEMRVDYQKNDNTWSYLHYNQFSVGSASEEYPLAVGGFTGVGTDRFAYHNGMKFSTPDNDNDKDSGGNCAVSLKDGWWYNNCDQVDINRQPPTVGGHVLFSEMKIRPKDCITQYLITINSLLWTLHIVMYHYNYTSHITNHVLYNYVVVSKLISEKSNCFHYNFTRYISGQIRPQSSTMPGNSNR